ncbi:MAG TPA: 50S ribosomal protein L29 [Candidatus Paceibacterota bacterium]|nr:50S ribosomal protein L29 [Candidatus Paceibacterota bacterium]
MKRKEIENLKTKSSAELQKQLKENEELLSSSKFDLASGKVKNIFLIKETKKTIARIKTFIKEKAV